MVAAAFNDVTAWILLVLAVVLAGKADGSSSHKNSLVSVWVLLSGLAFVIFMMTVIRPVIKLVARRCSREHDMVSSSFLDGTLTWRRQHCSHECPSHFPQNHTPDSSN
ncbi:hypothetical protein AHAS_Ahas17G0120600 [Arachis hypogaea]